MLGVNKGGVEVAIGDVRAFCPISQMDIRFVEKPDQFIGEKLTFRVTEVRERNVVLSRRALLEEEQKALAERDAQGPVRGQGASRARSPACATSASSSTWAAWRA